MNKLLVVLACFALAGCSSSLDSRSALVSGNVGPLGAGAGVIVDGKIKAVPNPVLVAAVTEAPPVLGAKLKVRTIEK